MLYEYVIRRHQELQRHLSDGELSAQSLHLVAQLADDTRVRVLVDHRVILDALRSVRIPAKSNQLKRSICQHVLSECCTVVCEYQLSKGRREGCARCEPKSAERLLVVVGGWRDGGDHYRLRVATERVLRERHAQESRVCVCLREFEYCTLTVRVFYEYSYNSLCLPSRVRVLHAYSTSILRVLYNRAEITVARRRGRRASCFVK